MHSNRIVHEFVVAGDCFAHDRVNHWHCAVLEVHGWCGWGKYYCRGKRHCVVFQVVQEEQIHCLLADDAWVSELDVGVQDGEPCRSLWCLVCICCHGLLSLLVGHLVYLWWCFFHDVWDNKRCVWVGLAVCNDYWVITLWISGCVAWTMPLVTLCSTLISTFVLEQVGECLRYMNWDVV